jgi:hypothetical protein
MVAVGLYLHWLARDSEEHHLCGRRQQQRQVHPSYLGGVLVLHIAHAGGRSPSDHRGTCS